MTDTLARTLLAIVTFGAGFSFVLALAPLARKTRGLADALNGVVFLANSLVQLFVARVATGALPDQPLAAFGFLTALFALGPANMLYHHLLLYPGSAVPTSVRLQFVPAALALAAECVFQLLPASAQQPFLRGLVQAPLAQPFTLVLFAGAATVFGYALVPLRLGLAVRGREGTRSQVRVILGAFAATLLAIVLIGAGFVAVAPVTMLAGGALVTLVNVAVFLATVRYPDFYAQMGQEARKARYERSMLKGLDTDALGARLEELMAVEAVYRDFDLSLETLAAKLAVTPHQLSQFLNERLDTNFRTYLNARRIEEAKKRLAGENGGKILAVCYDVGFSSKSTFNQAFRKHTGQTPSEYREAQLSMRFLDPNKMPS